MTRTALAVEPTGGELRCGQRRRRSATTIATPSAKSEASALPEPLTLQPDFAFGSDAGGGAGFAGLAVATGAALGAAEGALGADADVDGGALLGRAEADCRGLGLPCASPSCAMIEAGTLAAVGLSARHQISDQTEAPRARQV